MNEIASWIGAITGMVSLILVLYYIGVWKGQADTKLNTLWDIYVMDALHDRPDLIHHSFPTLTEQGMKEIPDDIKHCIDTYICKDSNYGWEVVHCLGMDKITSFAQSKGWTAQQTIGLLALYMKTAREGKDA